MARTRKQDPVSGPEDAGVAVIDTPEAQQDPGAETAGEGEVSSNIQNVIGGHEMFRADRVLESLRYSEYELNYGIGELVDNSVEAGAHNVWVVHKRETEPGAKKKQVVEVVSEIAVIDDGEGMRPDILEKALVLGETLRPQRGKSLGIGRFGLGMTLGALSLARRVELYSRAKPSDPFSFTYLDLNEVNKGIQKRLPAAVEAAPPAEYAALLKDSSGTIVILKDADRLKHSLVSQDKPIPADDQVAGLANWLGRTYRKFIASGLKIHLDGKQIYLFDPLFLLGPTRWDTKEKPDFRAKPFGTKTIELEVPGRPGEKAEVRVTMTLLPREFRRFRYHGKRGIAKERLIDENEGISVLRAGREVLYGRVPYLTPEAGRRGMIEIDRFWGCEVEFPPELDPYFEVRYIKRGAQPVPSLRKQLKDLIWPTVEALRDIIQSEFEKEEEAAEAEKTVFAEAEQTMAAVAPMLPRGRSGTDKTEKEAEQEIEEAADESAVVEDAPADEQAQRRESEKQRIKEMPYAIVPVRYPVNTFFETVHQLNRVIVKLNVNHPFYKTVFEPLCGSISTLDEDADVAQGTTSEEQRLARNGLMLLILGYAQAEAMFGDREVGGQSPKQLFDQLRAAWGMTLSTAIQKYAERRG